MAHEHRFESHLAWQGSTAGGYRAYDRNHRVQTPPAAAGLAVSAAPAFQGDGSLANPEQLLLAAASSCQLLAFLAVAARAGIEVLAYVDDAEATMPVTREPMWITEIVLRPRITVAPGTEVDGVLRAVELGHDECFVARSLRTQITVEAIVTDVR